MSWLLWEDKQINLLGRATWAGYAMSKARAHIGVDSGYMQLGPNVF